MSGQKKRFDYATVPVKLPEKPVEQKEQAKPEMLAVQKQQAMPEMLALPKRDKTEVKGATLDSVQSGATNALLNPAAYALPAQRRGKKDEEGILKRTDVPREQLNVRIRPELKRAAAGLAGLRGLTIGDVVEAALIAYLEAAQQER